MNERKRNLISETETNKMAENDNTVVMHFAPPSSEIRWHVKQGFLSVGTSAMEIIFSKIFCWY